MSHDWIIKEHTIPAAFPREYSRSTINPDTRLQLALKQYTPANQSPAPGDLTIIFTHGNGFVKELYEPFFGELLTLTRNNVGFRIRSIWALDAANQGASGVLNEKNIGEDPCWNDYSRDVEQMVNCFAEHMPAPRFGIGHSMGGQCIFECAIRNPSLFIAIVGLDPIIQNVQWDGYMPGSHPIVASSRRRDIWKSREEAEQYFRTRPYYKTWDPRVVDAQIRYGLRRLPTHLFPVPPNPSGGITLTTAKPQEVHQFLRPNLGHSDLLNRPECDYTFERLSEIKIPILYIYGGKSFVSDPLLTKAKMRKTPHAEEVTLEQAAHTIPQEMPRICAENLVGFLGRHTKRWEKEKEREAANPVTQLLGPDFLRRLSKM